MPVHLDLDRRTRGWLDRSTARRARGPASEIAGRERRVRRRRGLGPRPSRSPGSRRQALLPSDAHQPLGDLRRELVRGDDDGPEPEREVAVLRRADARRAPLGEQREPGDSPSAPMTAASRGRHVPERCHLAFRATTRAGPDDRRRVRERERALSSKTRTDGGWSTGASRRTSAADRPRAPAPSRRP